MTVQFIELEALAQADLNLTPIELLAARIGQYQDASPEEIFDFLAEVAEIYAVLESILSPKLRYSAKKEIEFFLSLYQDSLKRSPSIYKARQSQDSVQFLSQCAYPFANESLNSNKCHSLPTFEIVQAT